MAKAPRDIAASARQKLLNLARENGRNFQTVLVAFGLERLIYRLSKSDQRNNFVLKGGMLVTLWTVDPGRFTRDVDFLAFGDTDDDTLLGIFSDIMSIDAGDGLIFDTANLSASDIREDQVYGGKRLRTIARLGKTEIPITIDLGFGDALADPEYEIDYGSLLDFEPARIRAYSPATVMAEKFQAIVALGVINSRMKDYYDLWSIPRSIDVDPKDLKSAITSTFARRDTPVPDQRPPGLSSEFASDPDKMRQWSAYAESTGLKDISLQGVADDIWMRLETIFTDQT